jgi:iron complex outermembrane receptor protein
VIKVEDLTKQGVTNAEQAMQRIAANQSNFGARPSIGATTGGKAEADLRGLGGPTGANGNKTLVLLNGRRIVNHSFDAAAVDLNAIPLNAIDRIEVLRDGASAIYGTDAIGGVINFILKRDYQGFEMSAQTQLPQHSGGGQTSRSTPPLGWGSLATNGFNFMGSFDFRNQHVLEAAQRSFSKTGSHPRRRHRRHQRHQLPGRPERLRADAAELQPAGSIPTGRHLLPLRLLARRRHHSAEPAGHHPGQGQLRDHARSHRLDRVPASPRTCDLARRPGADQPPDAGEQPVLPRGATPTVAAFRI